MTLNMAVRQSKSEIVGAFRCLMVRYYTLPLNVHQSPRT